MRYSIEFVPIGAAVALAKLPRQIQKRIQVAIDRLAEDSVSTRQQKLMGRGYRIRVGDYRVVYDVEHELTVLVIRIGHRAKSTAAAHFKCPAASTCLRPAAFFSFGYCGTAYFSFTSWQPSHHTSSGVVAGVGHG